MLRFGKADGKRYTFNLKDELLPSNPENGREQATTSWEYDFKAGGEGDALSESSSVYISWADLKPTYRGKEKKDAGKFDAKNVKRFSIMMRRFVPLSMSYMAAQPHMAHCTIVSSETRKAIFQSLYTQSLLSPRMKIWRRDV